MPENNLDEQSLTLELEKLRKNFTKKNTICLIFFIPLIIIGFFIETYIGVIFIFIAIVLLAFITNPAHKRFVDAYKKNVVLNAFQKVFTNVSYDYEMGIPSQTIAQTHMMNMGDVYESNDYVKGKYKDINFEASDIHIQDRYTDSDGNTQYTTLFKGQWFIFDFNKTFKADLQVCQKSFNNARHGKGIFGLFEPKDEKFQKVELEDIDFNKKFNVFAQSPVEAFYVLTPNTMEKIKTLENQIKGSLLFCFINNKLHVGIASNKDLFEVSPYKKVNIEQAEQSVLAEMNNITQFVDVLNLDNTLFRREG